MSQEGVTVTRPFDLRGLLLSLLVSFLWGSGFVCAEIALRHCSPCHFTTLRFLPAMILLLPAFFALPALIRRRGGRFFLLLLVSTIIYGLNFGLAMWGIKFEGATQASVLMNLIVIWTAIGAHLVFPDDRLNRSKVIGLAVGFVGAGIVAAGPGAFGRWSWGNLFPLAASLTIAAESIFLRKFLRDVRPDRILAFQLFVAAPLLWGYASMAESAVIEWSSSAFWWALAYASIIETWLSFQIWYYLIQTYAVSRVCVVTFSMPVFAMGTSFVILGRSPTVEQFIGTILIASAIFAVNRPRL